MKYLFYKNSFFILMATVTKCNAQDILLKLSPNLVKNHKLKGKIFPVTYKYL